MIFSMNRPLEFAWMARMVTVLLGLSLLTPASADSDLAAEFKSKLDTIIAAVATPQAGTVLAQNIDYAAITRGVLGKHRDSLSGDQTRRFQGEFEKSMADLLKAATKAAGEYQSTVTRTRVSDKNPNRVQAYADIRMESGQTIEIIASMARNDDGWKVRNLIFDGVNLGLTYRNQFDQLMREASNDADQAIARWGQTTEASTEPTGG